MESYRQTPNKINARDMTINRGMVPEVFNRNRYKTAHCAERTSTHYPGATDHNSWTATFKREYQSERERNYAGSRAERGPVKNQSWVPNVAPGIESMGKYVCGTPTSTIPLQGTSGEGQRQENTAYQVTTLKVPRTKLSGAAKRKRKMERLAAMAAGSPAGSHSLPWLPGKRVGQDSNDANALTKFNSSKFKSHGFHKETSTGTKMAIIHHNHPDQKLEASSLGALQGFLWERLERAPDPLPRVNIDNMVGGALHITCEGPSAIDWLRGIDGKTISGVRLRVVEAKDLTKKPIKMAWRSRNIGGVDVFQLLKMLQRLNPQLHTEEWKVIHSDVELTATRRIILMDKVSADVIKAAGYCLHSGLGSSHFKLLEDADKRPTLAGDAEPSTSAAPQVAVENERGRYEDANVRRSANLSDLADRYGAPPPKMRRTQ